MSHKRFLLIGLLIVSLLLGLAGCSSSATNEPLSTEGESAEPADSPDEAVPAPPRTPSQAEGGGYDSPEEAVQAYLEGLKAADLNRMMDTFAIEIYVDNYDFQAYVERIQAYVITQEIRIPSVDGLARDLNIESRKHTVSSAVLNQFLALSYTDPDPTSPVVMQDAEEAAAFVADLSGKLQAVNFASIELVGFIPPGELTELYESENNQQNIARQAAIYGADEVISRVAVFELDGSKCILCMDVASYGGKWYNLQFGGNIGAMLGISSYMSGVVPVEPIEYLFGDELEALIEPY